MGLAYMGHLGRYGLDGPNGLFPFCITNFLDIVADRGDYQWSVNQ